MQVEFFIQNENNNTLVESFLDSFSKKPKKVYMILGDLKENGFKLVEEEFIDTDIKLFMAIGVNKKNTTRNMLESILNYTKDVYYYTNNDIIEFNSNICIFEYTDKAIIYVSSSSFSESNIKDNIAIYNKITVNLKDENERKEYKNIIKKLTKSLEEINFVKLNKTKINELVENKEIFSTRQYTHTNVKSISELLGKAKTEPNKEITKNEIDDVYISDIEIPKVDLSNMDLSLADIDISDEEKKEERKEKSSEKEIELEYSEDENISNSEELKKIEEKNENKDIEDTIDKDNELYDESLENIEFDEDGVLDINDLLFSKADIKLDSDVKKKSEEKKKDLEKINEIDTEDEILKVKKLNLNNISNVIMELPNSPSKEVDLEKFKVPNQLQKMIPEFFELQDKGKNEEIDSYSYKVRNISLEVIDVKTGEKYTDRTAKIMQKKGQSYLLISSNAIKNVKYNEEDIARIIKLSSEVYHIEIIPKDMQEYKLWSKLCNQKFKAGNRKFGMM